MKKFSLILLIALSTAGSLLAQSKRKIKHLTITIVDDHTAITIGRRSNNLFITRDDTAQVQTYVDLNPHVKTKDYRAANEDQLMQLLKPYYNTGWKLVTSSTEAISQNLLTEIYRFYLVKED